jgi:hypothetical protein
MAIQTSPSRIGQNQLAGDVDALFLKVFSGEIITTFEEANLMMPLHRVRTISSGKSAQFPVTGVASAQYHTPGESILSTGGTTGYGNTTTGSTAAMTVAFDGGSAKYGTKFAHSEKTIIIDDVLLASTFVADIDEMKNHYDVRSVYSREIGRALAYTADKNLIRTVIAGARRATDRFGGTNSLYLGSQIDISNQTPTVASEELIAAIFNAAQLMDEKNVPMDGRYCILPPAEYYKLVNGDGAKIAINKDYGGNGSLAKGQVIEIAGIRILKSNHIPQVSETSATNVHTSTGVKNDVFNTNNTGYGGVDFSVTKGIVFQTEAVGTVKLMDLAVETDYIVERQGTLMLAKYAMGHDVLREECCFELIA